jgi:tetratricopeptide (TPR) repeat protein
MKYVLYLVTILAVTKASAQTKKPPVPAMPDMNKLMKMSPAELEAYKQKMTKETSRQAADYADANGHVINKTLLPGFEPKPPVKDIKRLNLLPSQPPTRAGLVSSLQQSVQQIQKGIPTPKVQEIQKFTATQPLEIINEKAIADFYTGDPKGAILMMMQMSARAPDSLLYLNNLGAMMNLHGGQHKAIPIFQYCLQREPNSSMLLNNIGQSFMGLGDFLTAAEYFNKCLSIDSMNIEANHSMGMLHYFKKEYDAAMKCFEREMSIAVRRSTMAMAYKMGKKFDLRKLAARRNAYNNRKEKDAFEEITLGKFSFPTMPANTKELEQRQVEFNTYVASLEAEMLFWQQKALETGQVKKDPRTNYAGVYYDLVKAMLEELHEEFTPQFRSNNASAQLKKFQPSWNELSKAVAAVKCPPIPANASISTGEMLQAKCCEELIRPAADKLVAQVSSFVQSTWRIGQQRWKSYINQLVAIVQLDPSTNNQGAVYQAVSDYFSYLHLGASMYSSGNVLNYLTDCDPAYDPATLDSLLTSDQQWQLNCPPWLNMEVDFGGMVVKADCNKYVIEAGSTIMGAFEHEFKSGKSTLLIGPGMKGSFAGITGEMKTQAFITFDNNKQFSDFGLKNSLEVGLSGTPLPVGPRIKLGGNLAGVEISRQVGIVSGTDDSSVELKGAATQIRKDFFNWN